MTSEREARGGDVGPRVAEQEHGLEEHEGCGPHGTRPAVCRQQRASHQWFDEECERCREECDGDEKRGLRQGDRPGYSPITAQSNPIMMKKPVNRAMRPRPPYGVLAPT